MQEKEKLKNKDLELPDIHKTTRQIDKAVGGWKTSSSTINATVGRCDTNGICLIKLSLLSSKASCQIQLIVQL